MNQRKHSLTHCYHRHSDNNQSSPSITSSPLNKASPWQNVDVNYRVHFRIYAYPSGILECGFLVTGPYFQLVFHHILGPVLRGFCDTSMG